MRQIGASFDWSLLLWYSPSFIFSLLHFFLIFVLLRWVPEGTVHSTDYERHFLDPDDNAQFNALHDRVMDSPYEEEEEN
jgi:hypothetical protein